MPSNVTNFLGLSILALALGLISAYFGFDEAVAKMPIANASAILIGVYAVSTAISFGLIAAVAWGRQGWARWVMLAFFLLGLASMVINFKVVVAMGTFQLGSALLRTAIQGVALFFIFTGNAKAWFVKKKQA